MQWAVKDGWIAREGATGLKSRLNKSGTAVGNVQLSTLGPVPWLKDSTNSHGRKYNDDDDDVEGDGWRSGTGGHEVVRRDGPVGSFSWARVGKSQRGYLQFRAP